MLYPTETVWGLGGRASDGAAALRLARLKGRARLPLIVLVAGPTPGLPPLAAHLAESLWPGPLTLVVPGELVPGVAAEVLAPDGTVGIRWSPHPVVAELISAVGPVTSTSANRHGARPITRPEDLDLVVDAVVTGTLGGQAPSTVVHGVTGAVLRAGAADVAIAQVLAERGPQG